MDKVEKVLTIGIFMAFAIGGVVFLLAALPPTTSKRLEQISHSTKKDYQESKVSENEKKVEAPLKSGVGDESKDRIDGKSVEVMPPLPKVSQDICSKGSKEDQDECVKMLESISSNPVKPNSN